MPRISQAQKDLAAENQDRATKVALASGPAAAAAAAIPVVGPILAIGVAGVGAAYGSRALAQGRLVRDPPRRDFDSATVLPAPSLDVTILRGTPFEHTLGPLIAVVDEGANAIRAMIRALERASGAQEADQQAFIDPRMQEALEFAALASRTSIEASERAVPAREVLAEFREIPGRPDTSVSGDLALPDAVLAGMYRMGVPVGYLRLPFKGPQDENPLDELAHTLAGAAESDYQFGASARDQLETGTLLSSE